MLLLLVSMATSLLLVSDLTFVLSITNGEIASRVDKLGSLHLCQNKLGLDYRKLTIRYFIVNAPNSHSVME